MTIYKIVTTSHVYVEMSENMTWYNNHVSLLGTNFLNQISPSLELISQFPHLTYVRYSPYIRCCIIPRFPLMIHYQVDEAKQAILIIAILHMRRRT
ncbi:type II toxin-antitoxin system RelE/ParE family toxin [Aquirufa sp. TARAVU-A1A]|jgi:hypothetical protein